MSACIGKFRSLTYGCGIAALTLLVQPAPAQSGGVFDLSWSSIDSGGGISEGGVFRLAGTIGQAEESDAFPAGGIFDFVPGFLQSGEFFPVPVTLSNFEIE